MQRAGGAPREKACRHVSARARSDEASSQSSVLASELDPATAAGDAEAALLRPDDKRNGGGGGSSTNPLIGQLYVFGSAVLWGTSAPATRYLFLQGKGQAPTPSVVAAVQTTAAAICLVSLDLASKRFQQRSTSLDSNALSNEEEAQERTGAASASAAPAVEPSSSAWPISLFLTATGSSVAFAGLEIGLWSFIANCSTITGFENTTTSRGTFLIRLSAMFTPIVAALAGERFPLPVWLGCLAAFLGGILISADSSSSQAAGSSLLNVSSGDLFIVFAAFMWSVQTVSVGRHAPKFAATSLAKFQLATMSLLSASWLAFDAFRALHEGQELHSLWGGGVHLLNWGVILLPAIGPWSIGTVLQAKGQSQVSSALAMIILASDPLWATLFAGLVGGNEQHLGWPLGWVGAAAILSASVIASIGKKEG